MRVLWKNRGEWPSSFTAKLRTAHRKHFFHARFAPHEKKFSPSTSAATSTRASSSRSSRDDHRQPFPTTRRGPFDSGASWRKIGSSQLNVSCCTTRVNHCLGLQEQINRGAAWAELAVENDAARRPAFSPVSRRISQVPGGTNAAVRRHEGGEALGIRADGAHRKSSWKILRSRRHCRRNWLNESASSVSTCGSICRRSCACGAFRSRSARPSAFVRDWLRTHFADDIRICWEAIVGGEGTVEFDLDPALAGQTEPTGRCGTAQSRGAQVGPVASRRILPCRWAALADPPGARRNTGLAGFVVGPSNEYAFRAAELTARGRQQASPLLFCGPTGVGKTHLLRAIQQEYRRYHARATAVYLTAEQFTTCFVEAIRGSGLPSFRQKCRGANLLAIDDLQFFAGKQRTLEELLYTLDTLMAEGRQVVLASDRGLAELRALGPELISRLSGGLTCEFARPAFATRLGIVRQLSEEAGLILDDDVATLVATQITAGARELRGALHRLQAMSAAYNEPITRALAERRTGRTGAAQYAGGAARRCAEGGVRRVRRRAGPTAVRPQGPRAGRAADAGDVARAKYTRRRGARSANSSAATATAPSSPPTAAWRSSSPNRRKSAWRTSRATWMKPSAGWKRRSARHNAVCHCLQQLLTAAKPARHCSLSTLMERGDASSAFRAVLLTRACEQWHTGRSLRPGWVAAIGLRFWISAFRASQTTAAASGPGR